MPVEILMVLALAGPTPAWGEHGHRIVCEIAYRRLTTDARAMVQEIRSRDRSPGDSFAGSCLWADDVRRTTHAETYPYHFVNIPPGLPGVDLARDCADVAQRCAPWAIVHYATILLDTARAQVEHAEALKFLAHFVGDIHQPLHAGRLEDRGGNRIMVAFFGQTWPNGDSLNLHSVWDSGILARAGLVWPDSALSLDAEITPAEAREWGSADVLGWTNESYRLAETLGYRVPADRKIGAQYFAAAANASRLQLKRAGVRLAYLLNRIADRSLSFPPP